MSRLMSAAIALLLLLSVPMNAARQPVRARQGMAVAMEAQAADVGVAVSLVMTLAFTAVSLGIVAWIFKTGYKLKR